MSWGRIEWSMSTIVASGSTVRIAPFIAPMYSPAPKSVVNVTIALIRSTPSAQASEALFDSGEFLLSTGELAIGLRRTSFAVLQLRFPRLEGGLGRLQRDPLRPDSIALRREFREAFLQVLALRGDRLLPSLSVRLGAGHALFCRRFAVFDLVDSMLEAFFPRTEGGLSFLHLAFARLDGRFAALGLLLGPRLATRHRVRTLFELLRLLGMRGLGLGQRSLPGLDVLQVREERKSPSTTSAASDRSAVRSSAVAADFSRFSIAASRRFAAASRLSRSRSAVSIVRSRCWAARSDRSNLTACA